MSYLQRLAAMPTVQRWWPILRPLFGSVFQIFADTELYLASAKTDGPLPAFTFALVPDPLFDRLNGYAWRRLQECDPRFQAFAPHPALRDRTPFCLELTFYENGRETIDLQVGVALIHVDELMKRAAWAINDIFIPPELAGGGFHGEFLDRLIDYFRNGPGRGVERLEVVLEDAASTAAAHRRSGHAGRQAQIERIDFYRSRGFVFKDKEEYWDETGENNRMVREFPLHVLGILVISSIAVDE
jgi:hypothetical protein